MSSLPVSLTLNLSDVDEQKFKIDPSQVLSDYLSDHYYYLVNSFAYEQAEDIIAIYDIEWAVDDEDDEDELEFYRELNEEQHIQ